MPSVFSAQVTPMTTASAVCSRFTFITASREPGLYATPSRLAMTPSNPAGSRRSTHIDASLKSRVAGESSNGIFSSSLRRSSSGCSWIFSPSQRSTSKATNCAGISAESFCTRLSAGCRRIWSASKSSAALPRDDDLAVERRLRRELLAQRRQLGEVAQERPRVAAPKGDVAAQVLEHAAEAVPLRLVLPAVPIGKSPNEFRLHGRIGQSARRLGHSGSLRNRFYTSSV